MSEWGLSTHGFKPKRLVDIKQELEDELRAKISAQLQFSSNTLAGQLVSIFAAKLDEVWQLAGCVYTSLDPDAATGRALTALSSLTGTVRKEPSKSKVRAVVKLASRTTLPQGSVASVAGDASARFVLLEEVANNSAETKEFSAQFEAEKHGLISAPAHTLTMIATPIAGWLNITNLEDALLGRLEETDVELRLRRVKELRAPGSGTLDALKAKLETIPHVRGVLLLHNDGNAQNSVPVHAIEAIVLGGDEHDIAETIWQHKALGVSTHGSSVVVLKDSQRHEQKIRFSRPELLALSLEVGIKTKAPLSEYDKEAIKKSLVDYAQHNIGLGADVFVSRFYAPLFANQNIVDVVRLIVYQHTPELPFSGQVAARQYADFDVERIHIHEC